MGKGHLRDGTISVCVCVEMCVCVCVWQGREGGAAGRCWGERIRTEIHNKWVNCCSANKLTRFGRFFAVKVGQSIQTKKNKQKKNQSFLGFLHIFGSLNWFFYYLLLSVFSDRFFFFWVIKSWAPGWNRFKVIHNSVLFWEAENWTEAQLVRFAGSSSRVPDQLAASPSEAAARARTEDGQRRGREMKPSR